VKNRTPARKFSLLCLSAFPLLLFSLWSFSVAFAGPLEDTVRILERETSFHWGRDCLVWIVHYPEDLVDPWVDAEAGRAGMSEAERRAYRESFMSDISMGKAEAFLFTVYAFGPRPLSFAPFSEKVALVTSEGKRFKPVRYDRFLDQPVSGIAQGLVFFPKQKGEEYALAVQGMGVYDERLFAFGSHPSQPYGSPAAGEAEPEVVVVELPRAKDGNRANGGSKESGVKKAPPEKNSVRKAGLPDAPKVIERPQPAPPLVTRPNVPEIVISEPEPQSMADFIASVRGEEKGLSSADETGAPREDENKDNVYVSREKTIRSFLDLWMKGDSDGMYAMLSSSSRESYSPEAFGEEMRKGADFRAALRDGYSINWTGPDRAKITAVKRLLVIRTLAVRTLGVLREGSAWKIVW
jgi:hypothetical protein